jgi:hypothetical protein
MRLGITEIDWAQVGKMLANGGDDEQVEFFRGFVKEMKSWDNNRQAEMQLLHVNKQLTADERSMISNLTYEDTTND